MTASVESFSRVELTGLGKDIYLSHIGTSGTTPTAATYNYRVLAVADTAEALDLGDVATVKLLVIRAIDYALDVDLDFVSSFDKDFTLAAGKEMAIIPSPAGVVYVKNNGAAETPAYEYMVVGTT